MNNQRLISFDIQADFGFFKKPDYNDGVLLTYNMLHKPALLGILGAIIGLRGYRKKGEWPEYYQRLAALPVGIEPLEGRHEKGNFQKTIVKYTNTVGYANQDGNLLVEESMLIRPAYRCNRLCFPFPADTGRYRIGCLCIFSGFYRMSECHSRSGYGGGFALSDGFAVVGRYANDDPGKGGRRFRRRACGRVFIDGRFIIIFCSRRSIE